MNRTVSLVALTLLAYAPAAQACTDGVDFVESQIWPESDGGEGEAPSDATLEAGQAPTLIFQGSFGIGWFQQKGPANFSLARVDAGGESAVPFQLETIQPPESTNPIALSAMMVGTGQVRTLPMTGSQPNAAPTTYYYGARLVPTEPPAPGDRLRVRYTLPTAPEATEHQQDFVVVDPAVVDPAVAAPGPEAVRLGEQYACASRRGWCSCAHQEVRWPALRQDIAVAGLRPLAGLPTVVTLSVTDGAGSPLSDYRAILVPVAGKETATLNVLWSPDWQAEPVCKVCLTVTRSAVGSDATDTAPPLCFATHQLESQDSPACPHTAEACVGPLPPDGYAPTWIACSVEGEPIVEPPPGPDPLPLTDAGPVANPEPAEAEPAEAEPAEAEPAEAEPAGGAEIEVASDVGAGAPPPAADGGCQHTGHSPTGWPLLALALVLGLFHLGRRA